MCETRDVLCRRTSWAKQTTVPSNNQSFQHISFTIGIGCKTVFDFAYLVGLHLRAVDKFVATLMRCPPSRVRNACCLTIASQSRCVIRVVIYMFAGMFRCSVILDIPIFLSFHLLSVSSRLYLHIRSYSWTVWFLSLSSIALPCIFPQYNICVFQSAQVVARQLCLMLRLMSQ